MTRLFTGLTDFTIIVFNLMIYTMIVPLRCETRAFRVAQAAGCAVIIAFYAVGAYVLLWPVSVASAVCMTAPSFLLFLVLSRYRDSRFVLSFCLVDTVSLIVAFIGRYISMVKPELSWVSFLVAVALFMAIVLPGRRFFLTFRQLLETADAGWRCMAAATVFIYFAMVFFLAYPKPLVERLEYAPVWMVFAAVVAACYTVFIQSVLKTKRIQEQNQRLEQEKVIYHMAYTDALTGLGNRAAWIERLSELEREDAQGGLCCVVLDCDRFKQVNDTYGHAAGDQALRRVAESLRQAFPGELLFRLGGDEFAVLLRETAEAGVAERLERLDRELAAGGAEPALSVTAGWAFSNPAERLENTYIRADQTMYARKRKRRGADPTGIDKSSGLDYTI